MATSRSQAGKPIAEAHPALAPLTDARFSGATPGEAARGRDVVFLCLEHGESSRVAGEVFDAGPGLVVDLAADFRVRDPRLYERYYGPHPAPELVHRFTYGLADVVGCRLRGATRDRRARLLRHRGAARAVSAGVAPDSTSTPSLFAVTGSSGAGVQPQAHDPPPDARAQRLRLLGARPPARGGGAAVAGASGWAGPTRRPG